MTVLAQGNIRRDSTQVLQNGQINLRNGHTIQWLRPGEIPLKSGKASQWLAPKSEALRE